MGADRDGSKSEDVLRPGISRRGFMAGAAGLTGVVLSGALRPTAARAAANPFAGRVITNPGYAFLELNGTIVGSVRSFSGGDPYGDVVEEDPDPQDGTIRKHIAGVKYDPITLECALGMAPAFYDWVTAFVGGPETSMSGNIIITDANLHEKSRLEFVDAFITEVEFPTLDVASADPVGMIVHLLPSTTVLHAATG